MKRALEYLGYAVAILTLFSLIGPYLVGPPVWGALYMTIIQCTLGLLAVALLWPTLGQWSLGLRHWIFRKFVVDLTPEIREFMRDLGSGVVPDYVLEGPVLKKEGYRHISARIETIQTILEGLISNEHGDESDLRKVGSNVGRNFGAKTWFQMEEHVLARAGISGPRRPPPEEPLAKEEIERRLMLWAQMELTAGWGEFVPSVILSSGGLIGEILVVECFLAVGRNAKDPGLCAFLAGYMEEIISGLTGYEVRVDEHRCGRFSRVDKNCVFTVSSP